MGEWKEYKASMFCASVTDGTHDSPKPQNRGHYLITSKHLKDNDIDFSSANLISDEDYNKVIQRSAVEKYDILYSMIGTIGNVVQVKFDSIDFAVKNMGIFKMCKDALRSTWLYYWLKSPSSREYVYQRLAGSTQSYLTLNSLREFPVLYPGDITAKEIVSILKSLDDKIEVNKKINENLEQQAQALFKSWFVDFEPFKNGEFVESELGMIPKGWRVGTIQDLASKMASGGTPASKNRDYYEGDVLWYSTKELNDNFLLDSEKHISQLGLDNSSAKLFPEDTVLMAIYAAPTVGRLGILSNEAAFNQAAVGIIAREEIGYEYIYLLLLSERKNLNNLACGAAQQNLNVGIVKKYKCIIPSKSVLSSFRNHIGQFFLQLKELQNESSRLASLRDTLLPKLMSGELKVNEL